MSRLFSSANQQDHNAHAFHEPGASRHAPAAAVPELFWPAAMVLVAGAICLACWGVYSFLPQSASGSEKYLRRALLSPRFNPNGAEPVMPEMLPEPQREEPALLTLHTEEPGLLALPMHEVQLPPVLEPPVTFPSLELGFVPPPPLPVEPPVPPPAPVIAPANLTVPEPPPAPTEVSLDPLVYLRSTLGDTPMLRNWKTLAWWSLLTTTVIVQSPAPVAAEDKEKEKTILERIESLDQTIKKSFKDVAADAKKLHDAVEALKKDGRDLGVSVNSAHERIGLVEEAVKKLRADFELPRDIGPGRLSFDKASMEAIKSKLSDIEQAILKLQPTTGRVAMSLPAPASSGRVVLVNLYPEELLFVVNQKSVRVAPGANVPLDNIAAGVVNYEVISGTWGLRARTTTNLGPNETVTLTAR